MANRKRCCCNCRRNIRTGKLGKVTCHCEIDGHYISYVACFEKWCRRWARETKWDNEKSERVLELYGKLKPYADAEEQGRLVILPCKVGDIVWFCIPERRYFLDPAVYQGIVTQLKSVQRMNQPPLILAIVEYNYDTPWKPGILARSEMHCSFGEYGDWVRFYLTREEAEAAMKGLKGDTDDV